MLSKSAHIMVIIFKIVQNLFSNNQRHLFLHFRGKRKIKRRQGQNVSVPAVAALSEQPIVKGDQCASGSPGDDPGSGSVSRPGWAKRVARAALPLQLALVAVFCAACLLEPHCCDSMNTWTMSLAPQLRYVRGPPPV